MPTYALSVELWGQQKGHFPSVKLFLWRGKEKQRLQGTQEPGAFLEALQHARCHHSHCQRQNLRLGEAMGIQVTRRAGGRVCWRREHLTAHGLCRAGHGRVLSTCWRGREWARWGPCGLREGMTHGSGDRHAPPIL